MGLWRPWKWLDVIIEAVKQESTKRRISPKFSTCVGEINMLCERLTSLEQSVLQGTKRQVQGSNGSNFAQPRLPWGSTQTLPSEHNRVKHPCSDGHVTGIETWGIARVPKVDPREDRIRWFREKGSYNKGMPETRTRQQSSSKLGGELLQLVWHQAGTTKGSLQQLGYNRRIVTTAMGPTTNGTRIGRPENQFPLARRQSEELYSIKESIGSTKGFLSKSSNAQRTF